ncbi:MAG: hypothetical protein DRN81_01295 [Thermoproteota archaeon]|nr:MAG: hypothetical protein DRN81_01295 [Candidatus Korarchaeota archaeon]
MNTFPIIGIDVLGDADLLSLGITHRSIKEVAVLFRAPYTEQYIHVGEYRALLNVGRDIIAEYRFAYGNRMYVRAMIIGYGELYIDFKIHSKLMALYSISLRYECIDKKRV